MSTARATDAAILEAHTGPDGTVWVLDDAAPWPTRMTPSVFAGQLDRQRVQRVRVLGAALNVDLIVQLYKLVSDGVRLLVELGSPAMAGLRRHDPAEVTLWAMRQSEGLAASLGGWHRLTAREFPSYALAWALRHAPETVPTVLDAHPAWPYLRFADLDATSVALLLAALRDPRWYVDPEHPNRTGRFRSYLGLDPRTSRHYRPGNARCERYQWLVHAWKMPGVVEAGPAPSQFLVRYWDVQKASGHDAELRTSRYFASFLRHVWMGTLRRDARHPEAANAFVPEYYFRDELEVRAYRAHAAAIDAAVAAEAA